MNYYKKKGIRSGLCIAALMLLYTLPATGQASYSDLEQEVSRADEQGNLQKAIRIAHKMLDVASRDFGTSSEEYRVVLYNLGIYYQDVYNYQKSLEYYKKAAERYRNIYDQPPEMPDGGFPPNRRRFYRYEDCLIGMAKTYTGMGDFQKAEELYRQVLRLSKDRTWDVIYWEHLESTADFYIDRDNYAEGMKYYQEVLDLVASHYREDSYRYMSRLESMGYVYLNIGQYEKARELFEESMTYFEDNTSHWPVKYISNLQGLGLVSFYLGNDSETIAYYDKNISFIEDRYGQNSFYLVYPYINKSSVYEGLQEYDNVISLNEKGIEILKANVEDPKHNLFSNIYLGLGRVYGLKEEYEQAKEYLEKSVAIARHNFGDQSYEYGKSLYNLAVTYDYLDQEDKAWKMFLESVDINLNYVESNFTTLTNEERTALWNSISSDFANLQYQVIDTYEEKPEMVKTGYNYLLKSKAFLLQNTEGFNRAVRESKDPQVQADFNRLRSLRSQIASAVNLPESERKRRGIKLQKLQDEMRRLEQTIAASINFSSSITKRPATWLEIQNRLNEDEAAIEITRTTEYSDAESEIVAVHYAAYLLTNSEPPRLIELPEGNEFENHYLPQYRRGIQHRNEYNEAYNAFWKPLEQELEEISTIYFSPDGVYHQLSLNTLKNPETGRYLLDSYDIRMVTKTSDIVNDPPVSRIKRGGHAVFFGRPDFEKVQYTNGSSSAKFASSTGTISRSGLSNAEWTDLPGTEEEVNKISSMLRQHGWSLETYLHQAATESQVKDLVNPLVLHIATHGFFTSEAGVTSGFTRGLKLAEKKQEQEASEQKKPVNSMMQSGLVFSGVENFFQGHQQTEDGILTAYEASGLLLNGTELVVLSACETGLGEVSNGEGIYGLQRAFKIAGAESIIMSLWKVDDTATQEFMTRFYENWLDLENKKQAFKQTQLQIREKYQEPYYWGAFVMVGS